MFKQEITQKTIKDLRNKDEHAFEIIYNYYCNKVFYLALKFAKNIEDSNDYVQEIFIKILNNFDKFDERKSSLGTWIFTLSKNYLIDKVTQEKKRRLILYNDNEAVESYGCDSTIKDELILSEVEAIVGEEIYQVLVLKFCFDLTFEDIALQLNISPSKVKRLFYAGKEKIKEYAFDGGEKWKKYHKY